MHHLLATLGDGRMGYAQLSGYVLAPESLYIEHLQDDAVLAVSAIIEIADILYRLIKIVLKLVVGHVKLHLAAFLPCLKTLEAMLLYHFLQFIQQQESETIHHPGFERHARLPVFQRLEVVFAEIEIVFVSQREEVHARLVLQVISLIVDAISHPAVSVVILPYDSGIGILEALQNLIIR